MISSQQRDPAPRAADATPGRHKHEHRCSTRGFAGPRGAAVQCEEPTRAKSARHRTAVPGDMQHTAALSRAAREQAGTWRTREQETGRVLDRRRKRNRQGRTGDETPCPGGSPTATRRRHRLRPALYARRAARIGKSTSVCRAQPSAPALGSIDDGRHTASLVHAATRAQGVQHHARVRSEKAKVSQAGICRPPRGPCASRRTRGAQQKAKTQRTARPFWHNLERARSGRHKSASCSCPANARGLSTQRGRRRQSLRGVLRHTAERHTRARPTLHNGDQQARAASSRCASAPMLRVLLSPSRRDGRGSQDAARSGHAARSKQTSASSAARG